MKSEIVSMLVEVVAKGSFMTNNELKGLFLQLFALLMEGERSFAKDRTDYYLFKSWSTDAGMFASP
jgi:hypothetical protein